MAEPKVGDIIPGTNLKYEEADIQNLLSGGEPSPQIEPVKTGETSVWDEIGKTIMGKLGTSDFLSSEPTALEKTITESIAGLKEAQAKRETGIEASAERLKGEITEAGARKLSSEQESRRGFATNRALFIQIEEETQKSLKDLDFRKQEALASGSVEMADKINELQIQQLTYAQQQKQQTFSNMISAANLGIQFQSQQRLAEQAEFDKNAKIMNFMTENNMIPTSPEAKREWESKFGLPSGLLDNYKAKPEQPNIFGSDKTGYYEQYLDPTTNTWKIRPTGVKRVEEVSVTSQLFDEQMTKFIQEGKTASEAVNLAIDNAKSRGITLEDKDIIALNDRAKAIAITIQQTKPTEKQAKETTAFPEQEVIFEGGKFQIKEKPRIPPVKPEKAFILGQQPTDITGGGYQPLSENIGLNESFWGNLFK